jgi:hypothetical protein
MKIHPVGAELFHAVGRTDRHTDRRTDMTNLMGAFSQFANAPNKRKATAGY